MNRKQFLRRGCQVAAGTALAATSGCALIFDKEMRVCTLEELREQGPVKVEFNWDDILIFQRGEDIVIFSLVCSHKKCTVAWEPRKQLFECPCHDGLYDANGEVIDGPPPEPLLRYQWEIRGEELWVLAKADRRALPPADQN